jgi:CRP-like cAMP-binding protein
MSQGEASEQIVRLRNVPLFADLPDEVLADIATRATSFEASEGHVLVQPNMAGAGLFVIEDGSVTVEAPGRKIELGPGEFFGELALLDENATHTARVTAATAVRCLALGRNDFDELLAAQPRLAIAMLKTVARRLARTSAH